MHDDRLPADPTGESRQLQPGSRALVERAPQHGVLGDLREEDGKGADEIDLLAYWRMLLKRRWLILSIVAGALVLSLLLTLTTTPMYRATAVLQIDRQIEQPIADEGFQMLAGAWGWDFYQTQYELLKSRALAERVADELNLADPEARPRPPPSWFGKLKGLVRPGKSTEEASATDAEAPARDLDAERRTGAAIIQGGTTIEPVLDSALVKIHFVSAVPGFAAQAANALADGFIASGIERRFGASSYAQKYLQEQLALGKSRLEDSERQLVDFAQKEGLILSGEGGSLVSQNLSSLNTALAAAQEQRIRTQARWEQARQASGAALPADMLGNSILRTLQQQRAQLQGQYQERLQIYKPDYPAMLQLKGQVDELDRQIADELAAIRASVRAEYNAAVAQEQLLISQLGQLRDQSLDVDERSIQYNILKREVDTNRQLYDGLLQRYKQVQVAGNLGSNNISIVDRAEVPGGRFKPSLGSNLAIGLLIGLLLGVALALLLEFLDDTLKTPEDIEQRLKLAVIGVIPRVGKKQSLVQASLDLRSAFSEAYRSARTALQFSTDHGAPRILLITSSSPSEGKSTSALALARNFAQMGRRVLLIEGDMRNPSLARTLALSPESGLSNVLTGACALSDAALDAGTEGLQVVFAGPLPPNPAELLSGQGMVALLDSALERYDQVIIDGPPVIGLADAPVLASMSDGVLLVVGAGSTRIAAAQTAVKRLLAARARLVGVLLARHDSKASGYGYGYEGYYGYGTAPRLGK